MKIIKASYSFETPKEVFGSMLQLIENAGRTCYKSETKGNPKEFVSMLLKRGHESVLEHQSFSVRFICDRGVSHEIVRHRIASYSQESTRYCNYSSDKFGNEITVIRPTWCDNIKEGSYEIGWNDQKIGEIVRFNNQSIELIDEDILPVQPKGNGHWFWHMALAERDYFKLLELGWSPQEARSVLPNSLKTEIVVTMNLRSWRNFFKLRTAQAAHPQMRELAIPLLKEVNELLPIVFNDIIVEDKKPKVVKPLLKCPNCGAEEVESNSPRTKYACGSSDYDQRPGSFIKADNCF